MRHARALLQLHSLLRATRRLPPSLCHSRSVAEVYCGCHFKISLSTFGFGGRCAASPATATRLCRPGLNKFKTISIFAVPPSLTLSLPATAPALISNGFRERQYGDLTAAAKSTIQIWLNGPRPPSSLEAGLPRRMRARTGEFAANSRVVSQH